MHTSIRVPFLDLIRPHLELEPELLAVTRTCLQNGAFVGGPMVAEFEAAFAGFCQTRYCVGVGSGTDALRFALIAAGVGKGDAVVTVPNTFIATTEAISQAGAVPEFVDVDEHTGNLDPHQLRQFLENNCVPDESTGHLLSLRSGKRIAAVIPVHLYGQIADMDPLLELARKYRLVVVEDACQAHGAQYFSRRNDRWCRAGSVGKAAAFSFYPGKNLGACGEGGAVTTDDEELALRVRMLRDHGQAKKYYHLTEGYNGRLDAMQAGYLSAKLSRLSHWNARRRSAASLYRTLFSQAGTDVRLPVEASWSEAVYHLYVIRVQQRDRLRDALHEAGVETGIHYPVPLHLQAAYRHLGYSEGDFPVAEAAAREILSLPMFPGLSLSDQQLVVSAVDTFLSTLDVSPCKLPA